MLPAEKTVPPPVGNAKFNTSWISPRTPIRTDLPGTLASTGDLCVATGLVADAPAAFYRVHLESP